MVACKRGKSPPPACKRWLYLYLFNSTRNKPNNNTIATARVVTPRGTVPVDCVVVVIPFTLVVVVALVVVVVTSSFVVVVVVVDVVVEDTVGVVGVVVVSHGSQGPPQSIPPSPWFCIPSLHDTHGLQGPPQSVPSSPWFLRPSKQLSAFW